MMKSQHPLLVVVAVYLVTTPAFACMWDHDTLEQERARFPSAIELITGKFLRHSKEFYEWRIQDRLRKLTGAPKNLDYYDDLAVAYQKVGQHAKAVETMMQKEKIKPGLYETQANLGTFYILSGELREGLPYIDKALAINPHAHFDRERYQKWLVEYALARDPSGHVKFPLRDWQNRKDTFGHFLVCKLENRNTSNRLSLDESQKAVQAILGMMRFADYDNPLLLETLADLLCFTGGGGDAKQLAARAYLAASYKFKEQPQEDDYRKMAVQAMEMQTSSQSGSQMTVSELEAKFDAERKEADGWYQQLRQRELEWIRAGVDVDAEFDKLYRSEPQVDSPLPQVLWPVNWSNFVPLTIVSVSLLAMALFCALYVRARKTNSKRR